MSEVPKTWITKGHQMMRFKTWELPYEEVIKAFKPLLKGEYNLIVRTGKDGKPSGYSHLIMYDSNDVDTIRKTPLITGDTVIRKLPKYEISDGNCYRTLKTTAPRWITKKFIHSIFDKYNTDSDHYTHIIDGEERHLIKYPIIRFYPRTVERNGKTIMANVVYVEFSPLESCQDDAMVAECAQYRTMTEDPENGEKVSLIFNYWIKDSKKVSDYKSRKQKEYTDYQRQKIKTVDVM